MFGFLSLELWLLQIPWPFKAILACGWAISLAFVWLLWLLQIPGFREAILACGWAISLWQREKEREKKAGQRKEREREKEQCFCPSNSSSYYTRVHTRVLLGTE